MVCGNMIPSLGAMSEYVHKTNNYEYKAEEREFITQ